MHITIPGNPITKKNSQRMIRHGNRWMPIPSRRFRDYEKNCGQYITERPMIDYPVNVKCVYFMETHRIVDLTNLLSATCDILTTWQVIADDNCKIVYSHDGSYVDYDKDNPRAEITITPIRETGETSFIK